MTDFTSGTWATLGLVAFCGLTAVLHLLASAIRNLTYMHDLKHQVYRLKVEYEARKRSMNAGGSGDDDQLGEVDILPDEPPQRKAA